MSDVQPGILQPVPKAARFLFFSMMPGAPVREALAALAKEADGEKMVIGIGAPLVHGLEKEIDGLRLFPGRAGSGFGVPSTPFALLAWLRGEDRGELIHRTRHLARHLDPALVLAKTIDSFMYGPSLDLTGYEDGTENPKGDEAVAAAVVSGKGPGMDGSSFVAVQQWVHDLDRFESLSPTERDHVIGRKKSDNKEMEDAPDSAHVKRTAQESFTPPAFILRRSMPWADSTEEGLVFVAFGRSFDAFEALLNRMVGAEDGVTDALFTFTRPVTGSYFWCPPLEEGRLDLRAIGL
jgi:putative iron-dependent peroxidase